MGRGVLAAGAVRCAFGDASWSTGGREKGSLVWYRDSTGADALAVVASAPSKHQAGALRFPGARERVSVAVNATWGARARGSPSRRNWGMD